MNRNLHHHSHHPFGAGQTAHSAVHPPLSRAKLLNGNSGGGGGGGGGGGEDDEEPEDDDEMWSVALAEHLSRHRSRYARLLSQISSRVRLDVDENGDENENCEDVDDEENDDDDEVQDTDDYASDDETDSAALGARSLQLRCVHCQPTEFFSSLADFDRHFIAKHGLSTSYLNRFATFLSFTMIGFFTSVT